MYGVGAGENQRKITQTRCTLFIFGATSFATLLLSYTSKPSSFTTSISEFGTVYRKYMVLWGRNEPKLMPVQGTENVP